MPAMVPASLGVILTPFLSFWARLIDSQRALVQEHATDRSYGLLGVLTLCHLHESESAHFAGVAVCDNRDRLDSSIDREYGPQLLFRYGRIQVANKNINHWLPFFRTRAKGGAVLAAFRKL